MNKHLVKHMRNSALLAVGATGALALAYGIAEARGKTAVETVDVDFGQQEPQATTDTSAAPAADLQGQFLFLLVLSVLGMIGIVGILRDFRSPKTSH